MKTKQGNANSMKTKYYVPLLLIVCLIVVNYSYSQTTDTTTKTGCIYGNCENGYGIKVWDDGSKYDGNWKQGQPNGLGNMHYSTGRYYEGEFSNGQCNGRGILYNKDGSVYYDGYWETNQKADHEIVNEKMEDHRPKHIENLKDGLIEVMKDFPSDFKNITAGIMPGSYGMTNYSTINLPHRDSAMIYADYNTYQMTWETVVLITENKDSALNRYHELIDQINDSKKYYPVSFTDIDEITNDNKGKGFHMYQKLWLSMPLNDYQKKYEHLILMVKEYRELDKTCKVSVIITRQKK